MMDIENHGQVAQVRGLVGKSNGSGPPGLELVSDNCEAPILETWSDRGAAFSSHLN